MSESQSSPQNVLVSASGQILPISPTPHPNSRVEKPSHDLLVSLLRLLSSRMMWSSAKPFLAKAGLHLSRGWEETITNVSSSSYSDRALESACSILLDLALKNCLVGNKKVYLFDLKKQDEKKKNKFLAWVSGQAEMDLTESLKQRPFDIFSMPTSQKDLSKIKKTEPFLFSVERVDKKVFFQFFSVRSYSKRVKISIEKLTKHQQKIFSIYEELYGVEKNFVPCFDTVVVNLDTEILEFRVDFAPDMIGDENINPFTKAVHTFDSVVLKFLKDTAAGTGLMDLLPVVKPMYEDPGCGKVTALGFVAIGENASSNNHGTIQRSLTHDFRKDPFHLGGKGNVSKIEPYAIGLHWSSKKSKEPLSLEIRGSSRSIYSGKGSSVNCAELVGCLDELDFQFLIGQVLQRIKR